MLKDCSLVNIHNFAYKTDDWDSADNDMFWPIQVVPLDRAHPTFTDEKAGKCVDLAGENELSCIQQTINGIMPKDNEKIHAFRIGSPECKPDNTCGVVFAEGNVHADYLLQNLPTLTSKLNGNDVNWMDDLTMKRSGDVIPTLVSPNNDKLRVDGYDDPANSDHVTCKLQRLWGERIYKIEPVSGMNQSYVNKWSRENAKIEKSGNLVNVMFLLVHKAWEQHLTGHIKLQTKVI